MNGIATGALIVIAGLTLAPPAWGAAAPSNGTNPAESVRDDTAAIAVNGEPFRVEFAVTAEAVPSGVLYVGNDTTPGYVAVPLRVGESAWDGPALLGQVPAFVVHGQRLRYYAVFRAPGTGQTATVPAAGAAGPRQVWVVATPVEVRLGRHRFGALTAADAVVARVGADGVGWEQPSEGAWSGPSSFEIAADGGVWLLDDLNKRLLGWQPGRPDRPAGAVPLPVFPADFALGPNGTFYLTGPGTPAEKTMVLYSITADGRVRWRVLLATDLFNGQLRMGPDGVLYDVVPDGWIPVTTAAGTPLSVGEQRRLTQPDQPVPGGGRLVVTYVSRRDARIAVLDATGKPVRAWRVTSATDMAGPGAALPALADGDPVLPLDVFEDAPTWKLEQLALRLTASGAPVRLNLDNAIWGDQPTTEYRVGPDGAFYQLQTSRTTGVKIVRYGLGTLPPAPAPTGATAVATSPGSAEPAATATATAAPPSAGVGARPPSPPHRSWSGLTWAGGIGLTVVAALGSALLVWQRRRHHPPSPSGT
ncbi:MAG TPA: hypothetical protein VGJ63_23610 [Micromonosporaceae bacterium]|jgi:hypothetical protein